MDEALGAADLSKYPTVFDPATLVRKGLCPVSTIKQKDGAKGEYKALPSAVQSHSLYFEVHGKGPEKVVLIMGLNASSFGWKPVVAYLNGIKKLDGSDKYSVLVFDNRGMGNSDSPRGPYSTSGMANDVTILLEHVGWTGRRQVHIVGISMGGMIALELASVNPSQIASLSLLVTSAGSRYFWNNFAPLTGSIGLTRSTFATDPKQKPTILLPLMYPEEFLKQPATEYDRPDITNYDYLAADLLMRIRISRPQTLMAALSQMWAALGHHVTPERLDKLVKSIPKVLILGIPKDHLVHESGSQWLHKCMPAAEFQIWENTGHAVPTQHPKKLPKLLDRVFTEGRTKCAQMAE